MSDGTLGHGTTVSGATAGTIGSISQVGQGGDRDVVEISSMESTNKAKEYIAGMYDEGPIDLTLNYDGSAAGVANSIETAYKAGTVEVWTITYADGSTDVGSGFISSRGKAVPFDDKIEQTITIQATGVWVYTDVA